MKDVYPNYLATTILVILALLIFLFSRIDPEPDRSITVKGSVNTFVEIPLIGAQDVVWSATHHPFVGATPIDVDGDGSLEIFVGGSEGYEDSLFFYQNSSLVNRIEGRGLSSAHVTHGANSIDFDDDGDTDLILTRSNGVFWYENDQGQFSRHTILKDLPESAVAFHVAAGDIDKDGDIDLYISMFVDFAHFRSVTFNDPTHAKKNIMLRNDGNNRFTDVTESSGTAGLQNSFLSSFIDLNDDGWQDLVIAQNTGQVEIFRNLRNGTFAPVDVSTGWGFWMSLTPGDIDNDGDQDLFFSNSGISIPHFFLELLGDGLDSQPRNYDWILLRNEGDFRFSNATEDYQLDGYGFGWGGAFEDLTLDGRLDLLVAQNYIKWPIHEQLKLPAKTLVQSNGAYYHAAELGLENPFFGQAPLVLDIDQDGRPDVFWVNMAGKPRALLNQSKNNFLSLIFPDTLESMGARAFITTPDGRKSYTREIFNATGLSTDQWTGLTFGLGQQDKIIKAMITWADGHTKTLHNPAINQTVIIRK